MTEYFAFDELTWPEVQALPRHTPLIIPLGFGYHLERLAESMQNPSRVGLLPALPFGWHGSSLPLPAPVAASYLNNLLNSLRDDGFTHVCALTPQGTDLVLGDACIIQSVAPQKPLFSDQDREKVIVMPIGHTEQHGYHLPLSTDTLIINAITQGIAAAVPDQALALPVMPYGVSTHRQSFAGTLNADGRAFEDFWLAVIDRLVAQGFTRFYLLSGHGGNSSFLVNVIKYTGERHRHIFCATAWLYLSGPDGIAALEKYRRSALGGMGHACELETSFILHLRPELVHMDRVVDETNFITTPSYYMDWVEGGALVANPPWDDDTATGAYGAGSLATAEHGRLWLEAAITEKVSHVAEIHEQYRRRIERRQQGFGLWGNMR